MDLKNAAAVCLISLFSATLVALIARALDLQAASRIEPQLAKIVDELQAIRKQGGLAAAPGAATETGAMDDGLMVYYFHGNNRCPTCEAIESQSHDTVHTHFAAHLKSGAMRWKIFNYEKPGGTDWGKKFDVQVPVVVLARVAHGQIAEWKRLDMVWALVGDEAAFADYVRSEIDQMLASADTRPTAPSALDPDGADDIPIPDIDPDLPPPTAGPGDIPLPDDLPVPDADTVPQDKPASDAVPDQDQLPVFEGTRAEPFPQT
jgi:hypothetical protein